MDTVTRHRLSLDSFATLSRGDGSAEITRDFCLTEESRRLLLMSVLLNEVAELPEALGPLPPVDEALGILTKAQHAAPQATRNLLMNPGVGSGYAYALRRLRGGAGSSVPPFVDLGVVHTVALVAAARAGLTWSTKLPLRDGDAMLPTLGLARFPATSGATIDASTEGGLIHLGGLLVRADGADSGRPRGDAVWWPLRRIAGGDGDLRLSVWLDDLDPLRDLGDPVPAERLDPTAFTRWQALIEDAWTVLCRDHPAEADAMAGGISSIVPLKHLPGGDTRSASNGEAFGSIMVSEPPDATSMAVALVHEFQHIKLGALLHLLPLTEPDDGSLYYAPWRDDPRPLGGLIQGIYAFLGITRFWRTRLATVGGDEHRLAAFEYAYALQQTAEAIRIGLNATALTAAGRELLDGLRGPVEEWLATPPDSVDPRIYQLAQITADSHRIGWRLRHFRPRNDEVVALAEKLKRGERPGAGDLGAALMDPHPELSWRQGIPAAARRLLTADGSTGASIVDATSAGSTSAGENALLARNAPEARTAFTAALREFGPQTTVRLSDEEARAWAGLAISLKAEGDLPAAAILSRRPDLVRAVHARSTGNRSTTPDEVARWLAPALSLE